MGQSTMLVNTCRVLSRRDDRLSDGDTPCGPGFADTSWPGVGNHHPSVAEFTDTMGGDEAGVVVSDGRVDSLFRV